MNFHNSPACLIESLEPKLAPAGTVVLSTAGGVLTITGDAEANGIRITDNPTNGTWAITDALVGTSFILNGAPTPNPVIPAQTSIKATLGDGGDRIDLVSTDGGFLVEGNLTIDTGKGVDYVYLGTDLPQAVVVQGVTTVDTGDGNDEIRVNGTGYFMGAVTLKTGAQDDVVNLTLGASHTFLKGLSVDLGTGSNGIGISSDNFRVLGSLTIKGAGQAGVAQGAQIIPIIGSVDGTASISFTAGNVEVILGALDTDTLRFGTGFNITTGAGTDSVEIKGAITVAGALNVDLKEGSNTISFDEDSSLRATAFTFKGGNGTDTLTLGDSTVVISGALTATLNGGTNTLVASAGQSLTAGSINQTGTTGADSFAFYGSFLNVLGNITFNLGAGSNGVAVNASTVALFGGNFAMTTATGDDTFSLGSDNLRLMGNAILSLGNGNNELGIGGRVEVVGNFTYTGGTGRDSLVALGTDFRVGRTLSFTAGDALLATFNRLELAATFVELGALKYTGGKGLDELRLGDAGKRITVIGDTSATFGSGTTTFEAELAEFQGKLSLTSTSLAGESEGIELRESLVFGISTINLGAGNAFFNVSDSNFVGAFTANLGAGEDTLQMDVTNPSSDPSFWYGAVNVVMGAGNDQVRLGTDAIPSSSNQFRKTVKFDGGAGTDTFEEFNSTYVHGPGALTTVSFSP